MFHLGCFIMVGNEKGQFFNVIVEKNEVIHIEKANFNLNSQKDVVPIIINPNLRITLIELLNNCQNIMKGDYFTYNPWTNNCQMLIKALLESNNLYNETLNNFVYQPVDSLIKNIPQLTQKIATGLTNLGGLANKFMGAGLTKEAINKAEQDYKDKRTRQQNDSKNDAYYTNMEKGQKKAKDNSEYMKMTEAQKARYWRELKGRQQDFTDYTNDRLQKEQEERDRIERQREKDADPFSFMTDIVEEAVGYIPVVGSYAKPALQALRNKLEGSSLKQRSKTLGYPKK